MKVRWVRRNRPIAPIPYIRTEANLPRGQKVLVFLPHSDDGRYIGSSLLLMNRRENGAPRNDIRVVVVSSGHRSVSGNISKEEKAKVRRDEALCWAEMLGFRPEQLIFFSAEETYEARRGIKPRDQQRMNDLIAREAPTMVLVPHISDTAQHINVYSRRMVLKALVSWFAHRYEKGDEDAETFLLEYPTNHVPILPPSDKNFIVAFTNPGHSEIKHQANEAHVSQGPKGFDVMEKFVEAIDAMREADDALQIERSGWRFSRNLSGVKIDARSSRGENFGVTRLRIKRKKTGDPVIVEERVKFPLSPEDRRLWGYTDALQPE